MAEWKNVRTPWDNIPICASLKPLIPGFLHVFSLFVIFFSLFALIIHYIHIYEYVQKCTLFRKAFLTKNMVYFIIIIAFTLSCRKKKLRRSLKQRELVSWYG